VETLINIGLDKPVTHKYLSVAGAVASVQAAVAAGCKVAAEDGMLVGRSVIAAPSEELFRDYI
jgi:microcompartment protein CcmL/EutN